MKLGGVLFGAFFWLAIGHSAAAMTRINDDRGGSLGQYMIMFTELRDSGQRVMIDGSCFSACTLVTALIPKERVCVTERAKLGFHASWVDESGERAISKDATRLLYQMYPPKIQSWISRNGGLGPNTLILKGRELMAFYPLCK